MAQDSAPETVVVENATVKNLVVENLVVSNGEASSAEAQREDSGWNTQDVISCTIIVCFLIFGLLYWLAR